jgi:hypothetical protein
MRAHHLSISLKSLLATACLIICCLNLQAQTWTQYDQGTPPQHAAGVSPVGSYLSSDLGTVNLSNGSLNLSLPMGTAGGRGFNIPITLSYSSKVWSVAHDSVYWSLKDMDVDMAYAHYAAADTYEDIYFRVAPGWTIGALPLLKRQNVGITPCPGTGSAVYILEKLTVVLPDKGEIELRDDQLDGAPAFTNCVAPEYRGSRWHATDGSGAIVAGTGTLDNTATHDFVARQGNIVDSYREAGLNDDHANEEFRTVGFSPYAQRGEVTENRLRSELGQRPRLAYYPADLAHWVCTSCGP